MWRPIITCPIKPPQLKVSTIRVTVGYYNCPFIHYVDIWLDIGSKSGKMGTYDPVLLYNSGLHTAILQYEM